MYYRLKEPWAFRGWKQTPCVIRAEEGDRKADRPFFLEKEAFLDLLYCNGEENIADEDFSETGRAVMRKLLTANIIERSESPMLPLQSWQRYHVFPSRYLDFVHWSITGRCNFHCRHCMISAPDAHQNQLSLRDCLHIVDEIAGCGVRRVAITGGEPLLREDFEEIVRAFCEHGIIIDYLFTNASLLTEDVLHMLRRHGQQPAIQLSFDGLGHHDWLRGVPGAEMQADTAFRLLRGNGFSVSAAMCIHRENRDSLRATVNYLAGLGVQTLTVNAPRELGLWKQDAALYALTESEVWETYREYIPRYFEDGMPLEIILDGYFSCEKERTDYQIPYVNQLLPGETLEEKAYCESIRTECYIAADGTVCPCMGFDRTALGGRFPNILEHSLGEITLQGLYHDLTEIKLSDYLQKNPECRTCEKLPACRGGCMLEGIGDEGDVLVPDRRYCYFHRQIGENAVRKTADEAIAEYVPDHIQPIRNEEERP